MSFIAVFTVVLALLGLGALAISDIRRELQDFNSHVVVPIRAWLQRTKRVLARAKFTIRGLLTLIFVVALASGLTKFFGAYVILAGVGIAPVLLNLIRSFFSFPSVRFSWIELAILIIITVNIAAVFWSWLPYSVAWGALASALLVTFVAQNLVATASDKC